MLSVASWRDFEGSFFGPPSCVFTGFFRTRNSGFKNQNDRFLLFPFHFALRRNPGVFRGYPELSVLATQTFYAVFWVCNVLSC